jgi:hypothetical protein
MNPAYFQDMKVVDERLTALENKVSKLLEIISNQEQMIKVLKELITQTER